jgi:hypothetical protein
LTEKFPLNNVFPESKKLFPPMCPQGQINQGVKVNNKRSFNNLACRFCDDETEESQENLEECSGCDYERRSQKMTTWKGKVIFWRRMTTKISEWGRGE